MANIIVTGSAVVLKSSVTLETIKKLKKYAPDSLILRDDKERLIFKVDTAKEGSGDFTDKAVYFAPVTHDPDGLATVTVGIPACVVDAKEWIADELGGAFPKLQTLETIMKSQSDLVDAAKAAMMENITVQ